MEITRLTLTKPTLELLDSYLAMCAEAVQQGVRLPGMITVVPREREELLHYWAAQERFGDAFTGSVPQSMFWLVHDERTVVGVSVVRHYLTPALAQFGGHIGYGIRLTEQRKGYGTRLLALTLDQDARSGWRACW